MSTHTHRAVHVGADPRPANRTPAALRAGFIDPDADDGDGLGWRGQAECASPGFNPGDWFPVAGPGLAAKAVCLRCPVRDACLAWALEADERFGIWGGLSESERSALRREAQGAAS